MERSVAIKKLGRLLGKKFGYRVNDKAPTKEEREAARAELQSALREKKRIGDKVTERYQAILAADAEYQALVVEAKASRERTDRLSGILHSYKITVGTSNNLFFLVAASGDSWEEVIEKVATDNHKRGRQCA
jgi:hypothetical protein